MERRNDVTKERIEKELQKVRQQLATLQERQKDLEEQLQMAEDAEKMKFIEKNKISLDRLILQLKRCYRLVYQQYYSVCPQWALP